MSLSRQLAPLARRLRLLVSRATVARVDDAKKMQEVQIEALAGEVLEAVEHWQGYGLSVHPHPEAEALLLTPDGDRARPIVIACADRRYRLKGLAAGEVALFDDLGQSITLTRAGIVIQGNVLIEGNLSVTGAGGVPGTMQIAANVQLTGNLTQTGNLASSGAVAGSTLAMGGQTLTTAGAGAVVRVL